MTVLSQHTNDRNRDRAFKLRERFPGWEEVRDAPVAEIEAAIRPGGLAKQKAPRIQAILARLGEPPTSTGPRRRRSRSRGSFSSPARGRTKNRRLRPHLQLGNPRDPGRRPRPPGRRAARPLPRRKPPSSAPTTRCSRWSRPRTLRAPRQPDQPRTRRRRPKPRCGECELRRMCPRYRANRGGALVSAPPHEEAHFHLFRHPCLGPRRGHPLADLPQPRRAATGAQKVSCGPEGGPGNSSKPTVAPATRSTRRAPTATTARTSTNCLRRTGPRPARKPPRPSKASEGRVLNADENGVNTRPPPAACLPAS